MSPITFPPNLLDTKVVVPLTHTRQYERIACFRRTFRLFYRFRDCYAGHIASDFFFSSLLLETSILEVSPGVRLKRYFVTLLCVWSHVISFLGCCKPSAKNMFRRSLSNSRIKREREREREREKRPKETAHLLGFPGFIGQSKEDKPIGQLCR